MSAFKEKWEHLSPNARRNVIVGTAAGVALVLGLFFVSGGEKVKLPSHGRQEVARNIFTGQDTRQVGIDSINTEVKTLKQEKRELAGQVEQIDKQAKRLEEDNKRLQADMAKMQRMLETIGRDGPGGASKAGPVMQPPGKAGVAVTDSALQNDASIWEKRPGVAVAGADGDKASAAPPGQSGKVKKDVRVRTIGEKEGPVDTGAPGDTLFIPAGSILTGTLITGVDAPTHNNARRNPMPMLFRVKHEALLPNFFTADLRECFVIGAGYGELSSERAYSRSESITCIREDGGIIEVPLDAYAVGEDGKAGLRGRMVSKQGAILAKAMAAGFLEAFASMFTKVPVPQIGLTPGSTTQFQSVLSSDSVQSAALQGTGKALDRLAQFYIDMAEQYFPIIEVDAGRRVEFVLNHGVQLRIRAAAQGQTD